MPKIRFWKAALLTKKAASHEHAYCLMNQPLYWSLDINECNYVYTHNYTLIINK